MVTNISRNLKSNIENKAEDVMTLFTYLNNDIIKCTENYI